jgi:MoxR-like ATPase
VPPLTFLLLEYAWIGKAAEAGTWNRTIGYKDEIDAAVGHLLARRSVVFTGAAGVGKSLCIRELIRQAALGGESGQPQFQHKVPWPTRDQGQGLDR